MDERARLDPLLEQARSQAVDAKPGFHLHVDLVRQLAHDRQDKTGKEPGFTIAVCTAVDPLTRRFGYGENDRRPSN